MLFQQNWRVPETLQFSPIFLPYLNLMLENEWPVPGFTIRFKREVLFSGLSFCIACILGIERRSFVRMLKEKRSIKRKRNHRGKFVCDLGPTNIIALGLDSF